LEVSVGVAGTQKTILGGAIGVAEGGTTPPEIADR